MIETFALNPFIGIILAALSQTLLMLALVVTPVKYRPQNEYAAPFWRFFKGIFSGLYTMLGILFLDIAFWWSINAWDYAEWRFQLPSVLLLFYIGLEYVFVAMFREGSITNTIYFIASLVSIEVYLHWYIPSFDVRGPVFESTLPVLLGMLVGIYGFIAILREIINSLIAERDTEKAKWNLDQFSAKIFNRKISAVVWGLAVVQCILVFSGLSLFYWGLNF